jgi:hypothetical protein
MPESLETWTTDMTGCPSYVCDARIPSQRRTDSLSVFRADSLVFFSSWDGLMARLRRRTTYDFFEETTWLYFFT